MKKTICKREYDTAEAEVIKKFTYSYFGDSSGYEETLYKSKEGLFFLYGKGGTDSPYPTEDIQRLAKAKVNDWIYVIILSILAVICGIMLIVKTEIGTIELTVIVGIFLTAYSLTSIIDTVIFKENLDLIAKQLGYIHKK